MSATETTASRPKKRVGLWIVLILSIVVAAVLIGLPYLIKFEVIKWLETHGAEQAQIEDIDLNPFAGSFQVENLTIQVKGETPLHIGQLAGDIKMFDLLDKRVVVQTFWLFDGHLSISQGENNDLTIGGIRLPKSPPPAEATHTEKSAWEFGLNTLVIANTTVDYHTPHLAQNFFVNAIYVLDMHSWEPTRPAQVGVDMLINNQHFAISSGVRAFSAEPNTAAQLELEGLQLRDFAVLAGLADVKNLSGKVSFQLVLNATQRDRGQTLLSISGDMNISDFRADYEDMSIAQGLLHYSGNINLNLHGPADSPMLDIEGLLKIQDSSFTMADLNINHKELVWKTATKLFNAQTSNGTLRFNTQGDGFVDSLTIDDKKKRLRLANIEHVDIKGANIQFPELAKVERVDISGLSALKPESRKQGGAPPLVSVGKTAIQKISYTFDPPRLEVDSVLLGKLKGNIVREADGSLYALEPFTSAKDTGTELRSKTQDAGIVASKDKIPTMRLGSLMIANDAEIHWKDDKVKPQVNIAVKPLSITLGPIDTAKPRARTKVELLASLQKNNEIKFKGDISPLDPKPNSRLDGTIKGLNLSSLSSYAAIAGYTLKSGRLDANITAKVTDGKLDVLNKLVLTKLQIEGGGREPTRDTTSEATAMPLNVALGYLRDNEDRIKLDVPITGDLRDPKFNFNDVIRLATQAAAQKAAVNYLTQALQPLGTVLLLGKLANKALNALQLQAINFKPGDAMLDNTAQAYVQKIAEILKSRPGINLTICGAATESDRAVMLANLLELAENNAILDTSHEASGIETQVEIGDEDLLKLANQRSKQISDLLAIKHKTNPDQLFDCRPIIDKNLDAVPSVTLGI